MKRFTLTAAQDRAMDTLVSSAGHNALGGGSRSGKTFLFVRAVIIRALKAPNSRHAIFRFRFNAIKASIGLDTMPKVLKLCFPQLPPFEQMIDKTDWYLKLPNGSEIWLAGLDDSVRVEKILGMEFATEYFNECSQIPWHSVETAHTRLAQSTDGILQLKAYYDFNPPSKRHWTYQRFIEKRNPVTKQPEKNPYNFSFYLINPGDNKENLPPEYLDFLDGLSEKKRNRFLLGRFSDDSDSALWTVDNLELCRRTEVPDLIRVIIAIDPSGCSGPEDQRSDEVGITVGGLGTDGHGYLLEDLSGQYGPEQWSAIVEDAFRRHNADKIVGEKNYGGDMVRAVVQAKNRELPFSFVTATRGKVVRAEPIAALYDQGKIHHVGMFPELEDQQMAFTTGGYEGLTSPDRADSLVWLFTELFPKLTESNEAKNWRPPAVKANPRKASNYAR